MYLCFLRDTCWYLCHCFAFHFQETSFFGKVTSIITFQSFLFQKNLLLSFRHVGRGSYWKEKEFHFFNVSQLVLLLSCHFKFLSCTKIGMLDIIHFDSLISNFKYIITSLSNMMPIISKPYHVHMCAFAFNLPFRWKGHEVHTAWTTLPWAAACKSFFHTGTVGWVPAKLIW